MQVAIPKERRPNETRVAASPDSVKKLVEFGLDVIVETGAGLAAAFTDQVYTDAGASIAKDEKSTLKAADIVLKVQRPLIKAIDGGATDELVQSLSQQSKFPTREDINRSASERPMSSRGRSIRWF